MRTEERIERRELEPADVEFACELARRHEAADVGAPEWRQAQRVVDADGHVGRQGGPTRLHNAGPDPAAIALHPGEAIAVEAPWALVRAFLQRTFIVAA